MTVIHRRAYLTLRHHEGLTIVLTVASTAGARAAEGLLPLAFLFGACYLLLSFFFRRIGGSDAGSDKESVGAWWLLAAIVVGVLVATR